MEGIDTEMLDRIVKLAALGSHVVWAVVGLTLLYLASIGGNDALEAVRRAARGGTAVEVPLHYEAPEPGMGEEMP
jgi:hypothetical protein